MSELPIRTKFVEHIEGLGYCVSDVEGPFQGRSGSDVTSVYKFKINGSKAFLIEKSTEGFDRFVYRGPIPVKPKWVGFLNRFGLDIHEGPYLTFWKKELRAYKYSGEAEWRRKDEHRDVPFLEGEMF